MSADPEDLWAAIVFALQPTGRDNAISLTALAYDVGKLMGGGHFRPPALSTLRAHVVRMQEAGYGILTSPRTGVWIAADEDERLEVVDELRRQITAIEKRMQLINGGKCALRSCRKKLPAATRRRGGLYCHAAHRYAAALERSSS